MKKIIYLSIIALSSLFFASCGEENDDMYYGEQFFSFAGTQYTNFTVNEEDTLYQIPYGLAYPAEEDYKITFEIVQNSGGDKVTIEKVSSDTFTVVIPKGSQMGNLTVDADYFRLTTNVDEILTFKLKSLGTLDCPILDPDSTFSIVIQKFCPITEEKIPEWEGVYVDLYYPYNYIYVTQLNGDTLQAEDFGGLPPYLSPQPIKLVLEYQTIPYRVKVLNAPFYIGSKGPVEIWDKTNNNIDLKEKSTVDNCAKELYFEYNFRENGEVKNQVTPALLVKLGELSKQ